MMEELTASFDNISVNEYYADNDLLTYVKNLCIGYELKTYLLHLIENDNYQDYIEIYNICLENGIELPP